MGSRTFDDCLAALDTLIPKQQVKPAGGPSPAQMSNEEYMAKGFAALGIGADDLARLRVVHIAGTKGKGSTAVMCEAILGAHGLRTGLFTSPHLLDVRERVRLGGAMVGKETFARHFFAVWDAVKERASQGEEVLLTGFFRFMTLVAVYIFVKESVDVAILEVGMGGRLDATNAVPAPAVTGVTHIGYDHVEVLGDTLTLIASEKAGIAKKGVPFLIAPGQDPEAQAELLRCSTAAGAAVATVPAWRDFPGSEGVAVGLAGEHQQQNAALAVALCQAWLEVRDGAVPAVLKGPPPPVPESFKAPLAGCRWPGRCQLLEVDGGRVRLFIDGAHTDHSVAAAVEWFAAAAAAPERRRVLLFHCMQGRVPGKLLAPVAQKGCCSAAHFAPLTASKGSLFGSAAEPDAAAVAWVAEQREAWAKLSDAPATQHPTMAACVEALRKEAAGAGPTDVLVTGSLYLVSDVLRLTS